MRMRALSGIIVAAIAVLGAVAAVASVRAQPPEDTPSRQFERLQGFNTVVINHVNDALGTELLPVANGGGIEPGIFVTVTMDRVQIFDVDVVPMSQGRVRDETIAAECASECPAVLFDAFARGWLEAAVESTTFAVEIPQRVLLAVHRELPASTLLQVAYAAAETRPVQPPQLSLLVNNTQGNLQAKTFFLVPPKGLALRQGSAALGLTIKIAPGKYRVSATDPRYAREHEATTKAKLNAHVREIKKRYPSKETVILVPEAGVTVRDLMEVVLLVQEDFPRIVLSAGQQVRTP